MPEIQRSGAAFHQAGGEVQIFEKLIPKKWCRYYCYGVREHR
jgi:hypothetical protein